MIRRLFKPIFLKLASLLGITQIQQRLDHVESRINSSVLTPESLKVLERRIVDITMAHSENRLQSLNDNLVGFINAKQQQNGDAISFAQEQQQSRILEIRQTVDTIRRQMSGTSKTVQPTSDPHVSLSNSFVIDDALYVSLENHFRGSRDLIAQRQADYLPVLPQTITSDHPLVDLGCGRGEWLKVLRERGVDAIGVDSNSVCIAECQEEGLQVVESDLLQFLHSRGDQSVGTYTMFQVLEHLPFSILVEVLREIRRTLVPGGKVIAEVPNAKNLRVSAGTFWIDPTHQRPLFPELLLFLATEVGFSNTEGRYTNVLGPEHDLSGLPEKAQQAISSVLDALNGPGDFALIATA